MKLCASSVGLPSLKILLLISKTEAIHDPRFFHSKLELDCSNQMFYGRACAGTLAHKTHAKGGHRQASRVTIATPFRFHCTILEMKGAEESGRLLKTRWQYKSVLKMRRIDR